MKFKTLAILFTCAALVISCNRNAANTFSQLVNFARTGDLDGFTSLLKGSAMTTFGDEDGMDKLIALVRNADKKNGNEVKDC